MSQGSRLRRIMLSTATFALLAGSLAMPAPAEELARLTLELEVKGSERLEGAGESRDHAEGRFEDSYRISVTTRSSGELSNVNVKDPQFAQRMMSQAAAVRQQVERARPPQPVAAPLTQAQLEARAKAGQEACQGDVNCLMKLAQELQAQVAAMQATAVPAGEHPRTYDEDDYRFLDCYGFPDCQSSIQVRIDRTLSGEYADIQGMVPYTIRRNADYEGNALQRQMSCLGASLVIDVKEQLFYTDGLAIPEAIGTQLREVRGRATETSEGPIPLQAEISEWVASQLRQAPLSGHRHATIPLGQNQSGAISAGAYRAQAQVQLRWTVERGITP